MTIYWNHHSFLLPKLVPVHFWMGINTEELNWQYSSCSRCHADRSGSIQKQTKIGMRDDTKTWPYINRTHTSWDFFRSPDSVHIFSCKDWEEKIVKISKWNHAHFLRVVGTKTTNGFWKRAFLLKFFSVGNFSIVSGIPNVGQNIVCFLGQSEAIHSCKNMVHSGHSWA